MGAASVRLLFEREPSAAYIAAATAPIIEERDNRRRAGVKKSGSFSGRPHQASGRSSKGREAECERDLPNEADGTTSDGDDFERCARLIENNMRRKVLRESLGDTSLIPVVHSEHDCLNRGKTSLSDSNKAVELVGSVSFCPMGDRDKLRPNAALLQPGLFEPGTSHRAQAPTISASVPLPSTDRDRSKAATLSGSENFSGRIWRRLGLGKGENEKGRRRRRHPTSSAPGLLYDRSGTLAGFKSLSARVLTVRDVAPLRPAYHADHEGDTRQAKGSLAAESLSGSSNRFESGEGIRPTRRSNIGVTSDVVAAVVAARQEVNSKG